MAHRSMAGWSTLSITLWPWLSFMGGAYGHVSMDEPPQRSSRWRFDSSASPNYNDNQLNCGGYGLQYTFNDGKCGVCGDPWNAPRDNEAGGIYAQGVIVRSYRTGDVINVTIRITTGHGGYFEFRICPHNDVTRPVSQACLDQHVLRIREGPASGGTPTRFRPGYDRLMVQYVRVELPPGVTCSQCVLQFRYKAGNSWGCEDNGKCCIGCGNQENFVNCADIAIGDVSSVGNPPPPPPPYLRPQNPSTAMTSERATSSPMTSSPLTSPSRRPSTPEDQTSWSGRTDNSCRAVGPLGFVLGMTRWCQLNCPSNCPSYLCSCAPL